MSDNKKAIPATQKPVRRQIISVNVARDNAGNVLSALRSNLAESNGNTRAGNLLFALVSALLWARDNAELHLSPRVISDNLTLEALDAIVSRRHVAFKKVPDGILTGLNSYLRNLAGYQVSAGAVQSSDTNSHHAFVEHRARNSLASLGLGNERKRTMDRKAERRFKERTRELPVSTSDVKPTRNTVFANANRKVDKLTYANANRILKAEWVVLDKATGAVVSEAPLKTFHEAKALAEAA